MPSKPTDAHSVTAEEAREAADFLARDSRKATFADAGAYDMILAFIEAVAKVPDDALDAAGKRAIDKHHEYVNHMMNVDGAVGQRCPHMIASDAMLEKAKAEAVAQYHDKTNALLAKRKEEIHQARAEGRAEAHEQHEGTYAALRSDERDAVRAEGHAAGVADERARCLAKANELRERRTMDRIIETSASFSPQAHTRGFLLALDHIEQRIATTTTETPVRPGEDR